QQLDDRLEESDDRDLASAGERLTTSTSEVEANVYQVRNRSGQDPLNFPIKVNNRLANLLSMVERGDGAPNDGMRDVFRIMVDELDGYSTRLNEIWQTDLAAVNDELRRLGLDPLDPTDENTRLISE
ncbi:MAG: glycosyl hydrolase, partial [Gemmatimonadales bacterium]|nr:glycosyl hydrolase [Gemmatimonadales bacterium]